MVCQVAGLIEIALGKGMVGECRGADIDKCVTGSCVNSR